MSSFNFSLRKASQKDIPLIRELSFRIWPATYSAILTPDQMEYMLGLLYSEATLSDQMNKDYEFLIVEENSKAIGFASFSLVAPAVFKLHKIYLLPETQGKGAGRFVIDTLIQTMKDKGGRSMILNVNRHNKARSFYEKIGFEIIKEEDVDIGNGYFMNDYVMEKNLSG